MNNKNLEIQFLHAWDHIYECLRALRIDRILLFMYDCVLSKECDLPTGKKDPSGFFSYIFEELSQHLHHMEDALKKAIDIYQEMQGDQ